MDHEYWSIGMITTTNTMVGTSTSLNRIVTPALYYPRKKKSPDKLYEQTLHNANKERKKERKKLESNLRNNTGKQMKKKPNSTKNQNDTNPMKTSNNINRHYTEIQTISRINNRE